MKDIDFILATQRTIFQPRVRSLAALLVWCAIPLTVKVWDIFVLPSQIPPLLSLVITPTFEVLKMFTCMQSAFDLNWWKIFGYKTLKKTR